MRSIKELVIHQSGCFRYDKIELKDFKELEYIEIIFTDVEVDLGYIRHIELPEFSIVNHWSESLKRIKLYYNVDQIFGTVSDYYIFRKLNMTL